MVTTILVVAYCIIGGIFTHGITKEDRQDTSHELNDFSPTFVKICILGASLLWPLLIAVAAYEIYKEEK